jgi:hypothetical protein
MEKEPLLPISVDLVKEKEGYTARKTSQSIFLPVYKKECSSTWGAKEMQESEAVLPGI